MRRGDVVLAWYPFSSGSGGKRRPCLVIQHDRDNARLTNTIIAQITSNIRAAGEPTTLLIEAATPVGGQSGLLYDSLVSCINLATIERQLILRVIGSLPLATMDGVDDRLRNALHV